MLNKHLKGNLKIRREAWLLGQLLVFLLAACNEQSPDSKYATQFEYSDEIMGTSFSIKAEKLAESINPEQLKKDISRRLIEIDQRMSTYQQNSELSKINFSKSTDWQPLSSTLFAVLLEAQKISELTGGAFDITVGPLVNLWGFGSGTNEFHVPESKLIKQRLNQVGYKSLILVDSPIAVKKLKPDLFIDLSALAKGYAVDQVAEIFAVQGVSDYMIEVGGEIRLKGRKADGGLWRIAIEKPMIDQRSMHKILVISDIAIATSGDYRNFFDIEGVRYSHTIDPRSGWPVTHALASVTVLGHTAMETDALATAFMVLGPEEGYILAEQENIAAFFIIKSDNGFVEKSTPAFIELTR